jgi:hypothetical protein
MVCTCAKDAMDALDHIIANVLVYDKHVKEALDSLGDNDVCFFLLVKNDNLLSTFKFLTKHYH